MGLHEYMFITCRGDGHGGVGGGFFPAQSRGETLSGMEKNGDVEDPIGSMGLVYLPIHLPQESTIHGSGNIPFVPWIWGCFDFIP